MCHNNKNKMFKISVLVLATSFSTSAYSATNVASDMHPLSDEFIQHINTQQNLWRAGRNFPQDLPLSYFTRLTGSLRDHYADFLPKVTYSTDLERVQRVPKEFDARARWKNCPTLRDIRDQGACGSCWAVSAVSAMTDRICIKSNGRKHFYFSAEDVLSCCHNCGSGCNGGILSKAWLYSKRKGVVSGGGFGTHQGCLPYAIEPCNHGGRGLRKKCGLPVKTPVCKRMCQPYYKLAYKRDKTKFMQAYTMNTTRAMRKDIFKKGPITSTFNVYSDFFNYKSGVYYHVAGDYVGAHSVKIIGWGKEKGVKYWLVANSFNTNWGENGFFKILRGKNQCGIESIAVAGDYL